MPTAIPDADLGRRSDSMFRRSQFLAGRSHSPPVSVGRSQEAADSATLRLSSSPSGPGSTRGSPFAEALAEVGWNSAGDARTPPAMDEPIRHCAWATEPELRETRLPLFVLYLQGVTSQACSARTLFSFTITLPNPSIVSTSSSTEACFLPYSYFLPRLC
ncbi:hypothetical protein VUR80DRAFT_6359 [Thermomyces stellatus]